MATSYVNNTPVEYTPNPPVQYYPPGTGPGASRIQAGLYSVSQGDSVASISFVSAFDSTPTLNVTLTAPDGSNAVYIIAHSVTSTGFSASFSDIIPSSGWTLNWIASL